MNSVNSVLGVKMVDGRLVATARDIKPPAGWTNDFEKMLERLWGSDGEIQKLLEYKGIDTTETKPLYISMTDNAGVDPWVMLEAGSPTVFYLYQTGDEGLFRINQPDNLAEIVKRINDGNGGLAFLDTEDISVEDI
ncbi:hypothetical protein RU639_013838 [Aspergillus parasiticus]